MWRFPARDGSTPGALISSRFVSKSENYALCKDVEYIHQQHVNMCGDACLNMLLAYKGKSHEKIFHHNPRGIFEGIDTDEMKLKVLEAGLIPRPIKHPENRKWAAKELSSYINDYGPIICQGKRHFVLVFGANQESIIFHDPWHGPNKLMSLEDFNKFLRWENDDCIVVGEDVASEQIEVTRSTPRTGDSTYDRLSRRVARQGFHMEDKQEA